ncbi:MAG: hypothetical protein WCJ72_12080 [Chryseobacterium sp.]
MATNFFTDNNEDRIPFVEFIQRNKDILENLLNKQEEELNLEGAKFKRDQVKIKPQTYKDITAFQEKDRKFKNAKTTFNYFIKMNLGDDPVREELLHDLDNDEEQDDGFMENPERREQIREFEKWLNTEDVKKVLATGTLNESITPLHIERLKENMAVLSARPIGTLSETDPGGLAYQKALGKWEGMTMEMHDKRAGGKKRIHKDKLKKTKKKGKTKKYKKTRRYKRR